MSPPSRPRYPMSPQRRSADSAESSIRHYAMTAPTFFAVEYAINPWMDTSTPVDTHVAMNQWETLRQTYKELGHTVELVEPVAGLPDMVYAANGGLLVNGKAVVARFAYPQRAGESAAYAEWMTRHGFDPAETRHVNEGQGDLLVVGSIVLAGYGFRTDRQAHAEIAAHVADAGGQPRAGRPALLPPRHRAGGARRHHHRLLPAGVQRRVARDAARAVPRRHRGRQRRRLRARPQRRVRRPARRPCPRPPPASPSSSREPGSGRSASTCPSCSRAADPSNAARWRYIRDHPGHRRRGGDPR